MQGHMTLQNEGQEARIKVRMLKFTW